MDKQAFLKKLCEYGIDTNIVCFNDSVKDDVFCVINNYGYTDVFYRERACKLCLLLCGSLFAQFILHYL